MSNKNILIVDDDKNVRITIRRVLEKENMTCTEASSGQEALSLLECSNFNLVILDINMDDMDGFEVLSTMRRSGINTPVIFLSGRSEDYDIILGLGLGADDYITKPFKPRVFSAMIKAALRRNKKTGIESYIEKGPFKFDTKKMRVYKEGKEIQLSSKEILLMKFFMENEGIVFTKDQLYNSIWNENIVGDNTIMVYIHHLRNKMEEDPANPKFIKTVWGLGYKFQCE